MNNSDHIAVITDALNVLAEPGQVTELRVLKSGFRKNRTDRGYFNDMGILAQAAKRLNGRAPAIYITLNPVNPDLLARASKLMH